jgi:hypothetical protein
MCSAVLCYHVPFFLLLPFRLKLDLYAPYCPLFRLNLVVYLVCTKLLSELLSIWFLRSSDNTTTSATDGTSPHSPTQQPTLLILASHPPELPLFSHEWTYQIREQKTMETSLDNDKDKSLALKYFQSSLFV